MSFFNSTQRTLSAGLSVFFGELYKVEFTSDTAYYWDAFGPLDAYSQSWDGAANVVSRSEIPLGIDDDAGQLTLTMSGVDADIVAAVRAAEPEIYGRPLTIWGQFFDEDMQLSDSRFFLFGGTMDVPTYAGTAPTSRSIVIPCEGEWADRNGAAFSFFSDVDQKARYPGDKGLEYVYRYTQGVKRRWPKFPSP